MKVILRTGDWARRYVPEREAEIALDAPATARRAALKAGIPESEIGFAERGGVLIDLDLALEDGDRLTIHPSIIGG